MLIILAETKIIQSNNGDFKSFTINQSESSVNYNETFIFFDINQSEPSFNGHGMFKKFNVRQSELSYTSHGFFNKCDIKQSSVPSQVIFVVITNQNELLTDFKEIC